MDTAKPVLEATITKSQASEIAKAWRRKPVAKLLSGASMVVLPLIARGTMLGFFVCTRQEGFRRFDAYDVEIGMDLRPVRRVHPSLDGWPGGHIGTVGLHVAQSRHHATPSMLIRRRLRCTPQR